MKKRFTTALAFLAILFSHFKATSQCSGLPCTVPVASFDASAACILSSEHDLNCYFGQTLANTPISLPPFWCTSVENNQWFAFTASSPNVSFEIAAFNCVSGGAIQAGLLETVDCVNFNFVSDCLGNIVVGNYTILANNVPLTPGQVYYLMIDGSAGAQCNFVINGGGPISSGPTNPCLPAPPMVYTTNAISDWTISPPGAGTILTSMPSSQIEVQWHQPGNVQLCASSINCENNPPFCLDISVGESPMSINTHYLCTGETVVCGGNTYSSPGTYETTVYSPFGCDSIVTCVVIAIPPIQTMLGTLTMPCEGFYTSCGETITELGFHESICQSWQGCDSTVSFVLVQGDVLANAGPDITLTCNDAVTVLDGTASSQGSGFTYLWATPNGLIISGETTLAPTVGQSGTYCLTATNTATGCVMTDCMTLSDNLSLSITGPDLFCPNPNSNLSYAVHATASNAATLYFQVNQEAPQTANIAAGTTTTTFVMQLDSSSLLRAWAVDGAGCGSDTTSFLVNLNSAHIEFDLAQSVCNQGVLTAHLVGNFQNIPVIYNWPGTPATPSITVTQNGPITISITDNYGCIWTDTYDVALDYTGTCAYLTGTVRNNLPGDCVATAADVPLAGWLVRASNATGTFFGTTDAAGEYWIPVAPGTYTVSVLLSPGNAFVACGNDFPATVAGLGANFTQDFLVFQLPDCPYMTVDIGNNLMRRCANNTISVHYCNEGSAVANDATLVVTLDPELSFFTSTFPYMALGNNTYEFQLGDLQPGQCGDFLIKAFLDCNVALGQIICAQAQVFPDTLCNGYGPNTFMDEVCRPAVISNDPNVKSATPAGTGTEHYIAAGTEIEYNIRFQNTGNDTAFQVVLRDTLADKFDFSTLQMGASSHPYSFEFYGQRVLKLDFEGIKLPPLSVDEPGSMGFVQFRIKLRDDLPELDRIENTASIYFDNNAPVQTNIYFHTIEPSITTINTYLNESLCPGETYFFNGEMLSQAGEYSATFPASTGADSVVHLTLSVFPNAITELTESFCEGGSTVFNGEVLTQTGDYKITLQTMHGCDSIVNLSLDVWSVYDLAQSAQICTGASYIFDGQTLTQPGTYLAAFTSMHGCDSTVTLQLEVVDSFHTSLQEHICEGESYLFGGELLTQAGSYVAEYESTAGCDSLVTLNLTVSPPDSFLIYASFCEGDSFPFDGQLLTEPGTYWQTLPVVNTCDSTVVLYLTQFPSYQLNLALTACDSFVYEGEVLTTTGIYEFPHSTVNNCDSTILLAINIVTTTFGETDLELVQGSLYNGIPILNDTTLTETMVGGNQWGCDSLVQVHITVLPNATQEASALNRFEVFPNPAKDEFFVRFDLKNPAQIRLEVLDVLGRVVYAPAKAVDFGIGEHLTKIPATDWASGVYLVRLQVGDRSLARKIVVGY